MRSSLLLVAICSLPALVFAANGQPVDKDAAGQACATLAAVVALAATPGHPAWVDEEKSMIPQWVALCNRAPDPTDCGATVAFLRQQGVEVPPGLTCNK